MNVCAHCQREMTDSEPHSYADQAYHAGCHDTVFGHRGVLAALRCEGPPAAARTTRSPGPASLDQCARSRRYDWQGPKCSRGARS
jgi:hypothetical protein